MFLKKPLTDVFICIFLSNIVTKTNLTSSKDYLQGFRNKYIIIIVGQFKMYCLLCHVFENTFNKFIHLHFSQ